MTRIGACCLITIGVWVVIELSVQFGHYRHQCKGGTGARPWPANHCIDCPQLELANFLHA
jgi:H+-transporting ATPase